MIIVTGALEPRFQTTGSAPPRFTGVERRALTQGRRSQDGVRGGELIRGRGSKSLEILGGAPRIPVEAGYWMMLDDAGSGRFDMAAERGYHGVSPREDHLGAMGVDRGE